MVNGRIYIFQVLGILLLLCGYFLSDQPDNLSLMHFPAPSCPSAFSKAAKSTTNVLSAQNCTSDSNRSGRKTNITRHIFFEIMLPPLQGFQYAETLPLIYSCSLPVNYCYLFFEEINPPPPKHC